MDDASALRERVHGVVAAAPETWDESKVKGYDPNWDESKVVRDKDKGEEGQFAEKGGKMSQSEKDRRSFARWYAKQPKEVKEFLAWLNKQPKDVKDWFIKLSKLTAKERRALLGLDNLPDVKEMRNGAINLRQNLSKEDQARMAKRPTTKDPKVDADPTKPAPIRLHEDDRLQEDEVPLKTPGGAKLVDFAAGVARYEDGSTFDKEGWHKPMKASLTATATSAWNPDKRKDAAVRGQALPDGSYPIKDKADWYKARQAIGRGGPEKRSAIIAHLRKRAKALGIPESELNALTAAGPLNLDEMGVGSWDEALHPRGRDGKFIEKLGFVSGRFLIPGVGVFNTDRAKVVGFAHNKKDPDDPFVVVEKDGDRAYGRASVAKQVAGPKADITPDEEVEPKQLTLADAPTVGPPGTRPDLGTPGMNIKQNVATDLKRVQEAIDALNTALGERGNDDGQRTAANDLADLRDELKDNPEASKMIEDAIANSGIPEFFNGPEGPVDITPGLPPYSVFPEAREVDDLSREDRKKYNELRQGGASHEEAMAGIGGEERIANSPDELYENLYDQPDDLEQFPEAAETPKLDADVAPASPPTATRGQFTYSFDEGNWANAEVWRWNSETGEGEMIGRAHLVGNDQAQFVPNGAGKPFPRTFKNPQELLEVAAEKDTPPGGARLSAEPSVEQRRSRSFTDGEWNKPMDGKAALAQQGVDQELLDKLNDNEANQIWETLNREDRKTDDLQVGAEEQFRRRARELVTNHLINVQTNNQGRAQALEEEIAKLRKAMPGYTPDSVSRRDAMERFRALNAELKALKGEDGTKLDAQQELLERMGKLRERVHKVAS